MSAVEAAGYAMAPSEDDLDLLPALPHPDEALRNGHAAAAMPAIVKKPAAPLEHFLFLPLNARSGVRELVTGWWIGRAPA